MFLDIIPLKETIIKEFGEENWLFIVDQMIIVSKMLATLKATEGYKESDHCFRSYGLDFIIRDDFIPILIEVNANHGAEYPNPNIFSEMIMQVFDKVFYDSYTDLRSYEENRLLFISSYKRHAHTSKTFQISPIDNPRCTNVINFKLEELKEKKEQVAIAKRLYDKPNAKNSKQFYYIIRQFEHANTFRSEVHKKYNTPNVSNAWIKAYELFSHYKLFPRHGVDDFVYFDNAAFPGSFILAAWHYVHTKCDIKNFQWYGSSLLSSEEQSQGGRPLEDKYKLYEHYPGHWLMNNYNNGDVTSWKNQEEFRTKLGGDVDLYTSDLGFDVSQDFTNQESLHAHANMGQILTGLLVLKRGGNMVTKQYSYFEPFTISLMGLLTRVFGTVEISKPMFSKSGNSETYLVCLGYKNGQESKMVIDILSKRLSDWNLDPLVSKECLSNSFISDIVRSQTQLANMQIEKLNGIISEYNRFIESKRLDRNYISSTNKFAEKNRDELNQWRSVNNLERLPRHKQLNVEEVLFRPGNKGKGKRRPRKY